MTRRKMANSYLAVQLAVRYEAYLNAETPAQVAVWGRMLLDTVENWNLGDRLINREAVSERVRIAKQRIAA